MSAASSVSSDSAELSQVSSGGDSVLTEDVAQWAKEEFEAPLSVSEHSASGSRDGAQDGGELEAGEHEEVDKDKEEEAGDENPPQVSDKASSSSSSVSSVSSLSDVPEVEEEVEESVSSVSSVSYSDSASEGVPEQAISPPEDLAISEEPPTERAPGITAAEEASVASGAVMPPPVVVPTPNSIPPNPMNTPSGTSQISQLSKASKGSRFSSKLFNRKKQSPGTPDQLSATSSKRKMFGIGKKKAEAVAEPTPEPEVVPEPDVGGDGSEQALSESESEASVSPSESEGISEGEMVEEEPKPVVVEKKEEEEEEEWVMSDIVSIASTPRTERSEVPEEASEPVAESITLYAATSHSSRKTLRKCTKRCDKLATRSKTVEEKLMSKFGGAQFFVDAQ